jgi:hypothetical protein
MKFENFNTHTITKLHGGINLQIEKMDEISIKSKSGDKAIGKRKFFRVIFDSPSGLAFGTTRFIINQTYGEGQEDQKIQYPPAVKDEGGDRLQIASIAANMYTNGKLTS